LYKIQEKLRQHLQASRSLATVSFTEWTQKRLVPSIGTNAGAMTLPFQNWQHFKEAFAPELIERAISESVIGVKACVDPFGGSGTTGLACQFLGVKPTLMEVNPYLADLIETKLHVYDTNKLARDFGTIVRKASSRTKGLHNAWKKLPPTFVEPGKNGRWIFDADVAGQLSSLLVAMDGLSEPAHRRFFRILLGGMLIEVSNVRISGKGRRYRTNWQARTIAPRTVMNLFCQRVEQAISETHRFSDRRCSQYEIHRGDCRAELSGKGPYDLAVFSPPYANSFDYTDVYNIQLWMLGYLRESIDNRVLRTSTLSSHVQVSRDFKAAPKKSPLLNQALVELEEKEASLWDHRIPAMVGAYFSDMSFILRKLADSLSKKADLWMVVGDSRYAGVHIPVADILLELAPKATWRRVASEPFRSMRSSPQQGGQEELAETLVVLRRR